MAHLPIHPFSRSSAGCVHPIIPCPTLKHFPPASFASLNILFVCLCARFWNNSQLGPAEQLGNDFSLRPQPRSLSLFVIHRSHAGENGPAAAADRPPAEEQRGKDAVRCPERRPTPFRLQRRDLSFREVAPRNHIDSLRDFTSSFVDFFVHR